MKSVLMIGPNRDVKGGMTSVVDNYLSVGLDKKTNFRYIGTVNDKNIISKIFSIIIGYIKFLSCYNKYDNIHIHMASRMSTFRKIVYINKARRKNKNIILHIHGAEYKQFYNDECNAKKRKKISNAFKKVDRIIVLSEEWKDFFKNIVEDETKIVVIYNSIIIPKDFNKNINTNNLLFLGKIGDRKGIFDLIDVFEKVVERFPDAKLYVGGDGEIDKLKKIINSKKLSDNIIYVGWISGDEKDKLLKNCSFYVLPSYNEGMPMSVLEGMAYKNVTISTNVGGIPKVIQNEENGIIINPGDKNKLYEYIIKLLNNEDLRRKLSNNARKTIENKFDSMKNLDKLIKIYK